MDQAMYSTISIARYLPFSFSQDHPPMLVKAPDCPQYPPPHRRASPVAAGIIAVNRDPEEQKIQAD